VRNLSDDQQQANHTDGKRRQRTQTRERSFERSAAARGWILDHVARSYSFNLISNTHEVIVKTCGLERCAT